MFAYPLGEAPCNVMPPISSLIVSYGESFIVTSDDTEPLVPFRTADADAAAAAAADAALFAW